MQIALRTNLDITIFMKIPIFRTPLFIYICNSIFLLITASFFWDKIPMSESVYFLEESQSLSKALHNFWHPPFYIILLSLFNLITDVDFSGGYWLGYLSVIASGGLILKIVEVKKPGIFSQPENMILLLLGYFSLPAIFQGIFLFDVDNTVLTPILLGSYLAYLRFKDSPNLRGALFLGVILSFGLWSKMTTPLLLMGTIGLYHLFSRDYQFLFKKLVPLFTFTVILFWLTYGFLYTHYLLDGYGSFQFSGGKAWGLLTGQNTFQLPLKQLVFSLGSNVGAIFVWSSLWLPIPFILVLILGWKKKRFNFSLLFIIVLFVSYSILLKIQVSAGFPKYHYPAYSFLYILFGLSFTETSWKFSWTDSLVLICVLCFTIFFTNDVIYSFYSFGREHLYKDLVISLAQYLCVTSIPVIFLYVWNRKNISGINDLIKLMIIAIIIFNIGGLYFRIKADYSTNYHYGISKTEQVLKYANSIPEKETVYFPYAGIFMQGAYNSENPSYGRIANHSFFKPETDYIIMSDPMIKSGNYFFKIDYLHMNYTRIKTIGSYGVWKHNE